MLSAPCLEVQPGHLEPENSQAQAPEPEQEMFALVLGWRRSLVAAEPGAHFQIAPKNGRSSLKTLPGGGTYSVGA